MTAQETRPKVTCNSCGEEIDMNKCFGEYEVEGLTLGALKCASCNVVFPSYVLDEDVKYGQQKILTVVTEIRELMALSKKRLLNAKEERKYRGLLRKYEKLKHENKAKSDALMATHWKLFNTLGEVFIG